MKPTKRLSQRAATAVVGAVVACGWLLCAGSSAALEWQWGEFVGRVDSFFSVGVSLRTQGPDCNQLPNLAFQMFVPEERNPGGCGAPDDQARNGRLVNADDGNLNWKKWDAFSVVAKGSHDIELRWRNVGSFVRLSYFGDLVQSQSDWTKRTDLPDKARYRKSVLKGGVVGAQFRVLDAYLFTDFNVLERHFDFRVGNQVVNWGESTFTQGGINATNTLDVTKIRLPGSELREALLPAPIVKVGGEIFENLSFEAYYQLVWRQFEIDPPGTFFSNSDQVGRGAQGFFPATLLTPTVGLWGDPGASQLEPEEIFASGFGGGLLDGIAGGAPLRGDVEPSNQGQYGLALRYYVEPIEMELSLYYMRFHAKTPSVGFGGTTLGGGEGRIEYFRQFPEDIDLVGMSFNAEVAGIAVGGEISYRFDEPIPIGSALPDLTLFDLVRGGDGGDYQGFVREDRLTAILNGVYVVGPGTPIAGRVLQFIGAQDMNVLLEFGVQHFPDMKDTCVNEQLSPEDRRRIGCRAYATPLGVDSLDDTQVSYTVRVDAAYNRVFGSAVTLRPIVSYRHDVYGVGPGNGSLWTENVKQLALSLEANYLERWTGIVTYSNTFGGGKKNVSKDRDFLSFSASLAY